MEAGEKKGERRTNGNRRETRRVVGRARRRQGRERRWEGRWPRGEYTRMGHHVPLLQVAVVHQWKNLKVLPSSQQAEVREQAFGCFEGQ